MSMDVSESQRLRCSSNKSERKRNDASQWLPAYLSPIVKYSHGDDFFISRHFDPSLIVQLMMEGFLPIATADYLLPKLHKERCVIHPIRDEETRKYFVHTSHSTKKKCKRFSVSVNECFDKVVQGCHQCHGVSWLFPQLVESFKYIHEKTRVSPIGSVMGTIFSDTIPFHPIGQCPVRLYSIECWDAVTGELSAGELGYSVGKIYTSLTGFTLVDSAGSVQLAALGALLCINGFETWDLGMDLDYKQRLGAKKLDRPDFVSLVHTSRCTDCDIRLPNMEKKNCKDVMNSIANDPYQDG